MSTYRPGRAKRTPTGRTATFDDDKNVFTNKRFHWDFGLDFLVSYRSHERLIGCCAVRAPAGFVT
jgi:hypothetical protein